MSWKAKVKKVYQDLPDKKKYVELISAVIGIPMTMTVLLLNLNNLRNTNAAKSAAMAGPTSGPTVIVEKVVVPTIIEEKETVPTPEEKLEASATPNPSPTPGSSSQECNKSIGPIEIVSPLENQSISDEAVEIDIARNGEGYCMVVWQYRINGGKWSDYSDKLISIYNLTPGSKLVEVKVKSVVTGEEKLLKRNFVYSRQAVVTITNAPEATPSASVGE